MFNNRPNYGPETDLANEAEKPSVGLLFSERIARMQTEVNIRDEEIKRLRVLLDEREKEIEEAKNIAVRDITNVTEAPRFR